MDDTAVSTLKTMDTTFIKGAGNPYEDLYNYHIRGQVRDEDEPPPFGRRIRPTLPSIL